MKYFKKTFKYMSFLFILLLFILVIGEITLRLCNKINPTILFYEKAYNQYRAKPLSYDYNFRLNSKGFKDVEYNYSNEKKMYRILAIGDSIPFSIVPYEYAGFTLIEEKLKKVNQKYEIINMGIPSIGPKDYLSILVNEGLEYKPDMILLTFFVGDDFYKSKSKKILSHFYIASFIEYLLDNEKKYEKNREPVIKKYDDNVPTFDEEFYLKLALKRSYIFQKNNPIFLNNFDWSISYIKKIKEISDFKKIPLLIIICPDEMQINLDLQNSVIKASKIDSKNFDFAQPNKLLSKEFKHDNIPCFDLLDDLYLIANSKKTNLYKPRDTHWNIAGNKIVAEIIYKKLAAFIKENPIKH